jgi:DNA-binding transcriptional MocR family regulator
MSARIEANRMTAQRAILLLVREGMICSAPGPGVFERWHGRLCDESEEWKAATTAELDQAIGILVRLTEPRGQAAVIPFAVIEGGSTAPVDRSRRRTSLSRQEAN